MKTDQMAIDELTAENKELIRCFNESTASLKKMQEDSTKYQ